MGLPRPRPCVDTTAPQEVAGSLKPGNDSGRIPNPPFLLAKLDGRKCEAQEKHNNNNNDDNERQSWKYRGKSAESGEHAMEKLPPPFFSFLWNTVYSFSFAPIMEPSSLTG